MNLVGRDFLTLKDYTEELALQNEIVKQDSAFSKEYCENLWNMVME